MKIFIDADYKCRLESGEGLREVETDSFSGKCRTFVEGYRLIPQGETWTDANGNHIRGEAVFPWRDYALLEEFQRQYEEMLAQQADMAAALALLGVVEEGEV